MYSDINEKIDQARLGIARLSKIDSMQNKLRQELEELERKEEELKAVLDKENDDVKKLETKSIAHVFYSILGSLPDRVAEERKEAFAAKFKYDQVIRDIEDIKSQISTLTAEKMAYLDCKKDFDRLYAQKKEALMRESGGTAEELLHLDDSINQARVNLKEIKEAITAGGRVVESLDCALESLRKARGWGTYDMLGGGLISDIAKHSHIDEAKGEVEQAQRLLRQFNTELTDINLNADISIETEGFRKFTDFFFDGLIADWFMQSKINDSFDNVSDVRSQVQTIIGKLRYMESQEDSKIERVKKEIEYLIINTK